VIWECCSVEEEFSEKLIINVEYFEQIRMVAHFRSFLNLRKQILLCEFHVRLLSPVLVTCKIDGNYVLYSDWKCSQNVWIDYI
jgi:hypothetical protein